RVEGEDPRLELGERDAVIRARELLAEEQGAVLADEVDPDQAVRKLRRRLDRLRQARPQIRLHRQPVDDDLDRVLELLVERDLLLEEPLLAVDLDPREALAPKLLEDVLVLALTVPHDRRVHGELRAVR